LFEVAKEGPDWAVWDRLFNAQVKVGFPQEVANFISSPRWRRGRSVLDIGAGNAAYLLALNQALPGKLWRGIDIDANLIACGRLAALGHSNITLEVADAFTVVVVEELVLLRAVLQHLKEPEALGERIGKQLGSNTAVSIVEAVDEPLIFEPPCPRLSQVFGELRENQAANRGGRTDPTSCFLEGIGREVAMEVVADRRQDLVSVGDEARSALTSMYEQSLTMLARRSLISDESWFESITELHMWADSPRAFSAMTIRYLECVRKSGE